MYQIHSQRLKNNQSYNINKVENRVEGRVGHKRGFSEQMCQYSEMGEVNNKGKKMQDVKIGGHYKN